MFVSDNQLYYFSLCLLFGLIFGVNIVISRLIFLFSGNKIIKVITDLTSFIIITIIYMWFSYKYNLPNFRVYMIIGVICGIVLINKSLYYILAKACKKVYNIIKRKLRKQKRIKNDGEKG